MLAAGPGCDYRYTYGIVSTANYFPNIHSISLSVITVCWNLLIVCKRCSENEKFSRLCLQKSYLWWFEWRFFIVLICVRRISVPHMTESPRLQLSSDAPRIHQYELESVSPRKPVTDCCPEPDPYVTYKLKIKKRDDWLYLVTVQSHCVSFVNQFDDTSACYEVGCRDCSEKKSRQQHLKWRKVNSSCSWISWNYQNKARSICASLSISSRLRPALPSLSCFSSSE